MGFEVGKKYRIKNYGTEERINPSKIHVLMEDDRGFIIEHFAGEFAFPSNAPGSKESAVFRVTGDKAVFWEEIKPKRRIHWVHTDRYIRKLGEGLAEVTEPSAAEVGVQLEPGDRFVWVWA